MTITLLSFRVALYAFTDLKKYDFKEIIDRFSDTSTAGILMLDHAQLASVTYSPNGSPTFS